MDKTNTAPCWIPAVGKLRLMMDDDDSYKFVWLWQRQRRTEVSGNTFIILSRNTFRNEKYDIEYEDYFNNI